MPPSRSGREPVSLPAVAVDIGEAPMDVFAEPVASLAPYVPPSSIASVWSNPVIGDLRERKRAALVPGVVPVVHRLGEDMENLRLTTPLKRRGEELSPLVQPIPKLAYWEFRDPLDELDEFEDEWDE